MTAHTLYETDADFRTLIQLWIRDKRCPLVMADYLRECGLPLVAAGAEWASWEKELDQFPLWGTDVKYRAGPYPNSKTTEPQEGYYWFRENNRQHANCLPTPLFKKVARYSGGESVSSDCGFDTVEFGLLALLDGYADALRDGVPVPTAEVGAMGGVG